VRVCACILHDAEVIIICIIEPCLRVCVCVYVCVCARARTRARARARACTVLAERRLVESAPSLNPDLNPNLNPKLSILARQNLQSPRPETSCSVRASIECVLLL